MKKVLEDVQKWYFNIYNHLTMWLCYIRFRSVSPRYNAQFYPSSHYKIFLPAIKVIFYSKFFDKN